MLRQWQGSGLSIRAFCRKHNLAEPSFYAWRRTLAERDPAAHPALAEPDPAHQAQRQRTPSDRREHAQIPPLFVPLRVAASASVLEVVLSQGRVVRVPAGFDPATLRQLLAVLEEERPC
jgi:transposase-like protein